MTGVNHQWNDSDNYDDIDWEDQDNSSANRNQKGKGSLLGFRDNYEQMKGNFNYGRMLSRALQEAKYDPDIRLSKSWTSTIAPALREKAISYSVTTAYYADIDRYITFLQMTQGDEIVSLPIDATVVKKMMSQMEHVKLTPEQRRKTNERKAQERLRKANRTPHEFVVWATVAGRCKRCHKGRNTNAHLTALAK